MLAGGFTFVDFVGGVTEGTEDKDFFFGSGDVSFVFREEGFGKEGGGGGIGFWLWGKGG